MSLETEQLVALLESMGCTKFKIPEDGYGEKILCTCPMHHDTNPSFMLRPGSHVYNCFACGSGPDIKGFAPVTAGLPSLMMKHYLHAYNKKITFKKARSLVEKVVSPQFLKRKRRKKAKDFNEYSLETIPNNYLDAYYPSQVAIDYMKTRGFTEETCRRFKIGYDRIRKRVVIPVYDEMGRLVTFSGRITGSKKEIDAKNKQREAAGRKPIPRYLIYYKAPRRFLMLNAEQALSSYDEIIVVESAMDYLALRQMGIDDVVCIFGSHLTDYQWSLIEHCKKIYAFLDNDPAGASGIEAILKRTQKTNNIVYIPDYKPEDGDFDEMSKDRFLELYHGAIPVSRFKKTIPLIA